MEHQLSQYSSDGQHEAIPIVFQWLDEAFHGVHLADGFVVVPLHPDTPFMVTAVDSVDAGRLLDVRAPFVDRVPLSPALDQYIAQNDVVAEGHLHVVPDLADATVGRLEVRYRIAVNLMDQQSLVQLGLRLSMSTSGIGPYIQQRFGGVVVKS